MKELFSTTQRGIILTIIFVASFIISLIYLYRRVDYKKTSMIIFISCWIYFSLFVSLNIIALFDFLIASYKGIEKFVKSITIFYEIFYWTDKVLGFIIFTLLIYYLESGYYKTIKRLVDFFIRNIINNIKKKGICKIIAGICVAVPVLGGIIALLVKNRKRYGYSSPLDYIGVLLDFYGLIKIYNSVGFFLIQIFFDCKRKRDKKLIERYYRYSIIKIIETTENNINKMKHCYEVLYQEVQKLDKNISSDYNNYLKETLKQINETINALEKEGNKNDNNNNKNANININNNINLNMNFNMNNNNNNLNNYHFNNNRNNYIINNYNLYNNRSNEINYLKPNSNQNRRNIQSEENNLRYSQDNTERVVKNKDEKDKEKNKKMDIPTCIRKYKNYKRKIYKLKQLFKEIKKEKDQDIKKLQSQDSRDDKCCCSCGYIILFIVFIMVIGTDFILPISLYNEENYYESNDDSDVDGSILELIIFVLISIALSFIFSAYTVVIIFSTTRKRYISGDFLYDKQINDNLNLLKTVQIICGYSFSLIYCNYYVFRSMDKNGYIGEPKFSKKFSIPDFNLKNGVTAFMIGKIIIIIISIIANLCCNKTFIFKNDLAEYDLNSLCDNTCIFDDDVELNKVLTEKYKIYNILNN